MEQTRIVSLIESFVNLLSGMVISVLVWQFFVAYFWPYLKPDFHDNVIITSIFTVVSLARSYFWRRFFNNGLHKALVRWVGKLVRAQQHVKYTERSGLYIRCPYCQYWMEGAWAIKAGTFRCPRCHNLWEDTNVPR